MNKYCEFCKNVETGNDFNPMVSMRVDFGMFGTADIDVDLTREYENPKEPRLMVSITPFYGENSLCDKVPIKFCPMCGREL